MIISRIKLQNWRNFKQLDLKLGKRVFIVGPNASGKSNLLDAFRFLRDIAKGSGGGLQKAFRDRGGLSMVRCLAARSNPHIHFEVELSQSPEGPEIFRYAIGITQETKGHRRPVVKYERVSRNGTKLLDRPDVQDRDDPERLTETFLEQTTANKEFRDIASFLNGICYLHLVPQLLRFPEAFSGTPLSEDPFGKTFLERLAKTPEKTRSRRLKRIEGALKIIAPNLTHLEFRKDTTGVPHLCALYKHWRPDAGNQNEMQFSDGTLRSIGLFWAMMESNHLLLLEEPELSLNVEIIKEIPSLVHKITHPQQRQVIMSTHSYELLSDKGIGGEETVILRPGKEGTEAHLLSDNKPSAEMLRLGMSVAEVAIPLGSPENVVQMKLSFN
jgi:ABC-type branched-subunit amino acid transport system ATPase component